MLLYEKLFKRNVTMQEGAVRHGETEAEGGFKGLPLHVGIFTQYRHMGRTQQNLHLHSNRLNRNRIT